MRIGCPDTDRTRRSKQQRVPARPNKCQRVPLRLILFAVKVTYVALSRAYTKRTPTVRFPPPPRCPDLFPAGQGISYLLTRARTNPKGHGAALPRAAYMDRPMVRALWRQLVQGMGLSRGPRRAYRPARARVTSQPTTSGGLEALTPTVPPRGPAPRGHPAPRGTPPRTIHPTERRRRPSDLDRLARTHR
jgi:hypothetical protein